MAFLLGLCRANANQQPSSQTGVLPCANADLLDFLLRDPDTLDLAALRALRGKTVLMLATAELIGT